MVSLSLNNCINALKEKMRTSLTLSSKISDAILCN